VVAVSKTKAKSEYLEHIEVASWLRVRGIRFHHSPNETYTNSFAQLAKNRRLGVSRGFPDLLIVLPSGLAFIELKRTKGGVVATEQEGWLDALEAVGARCAVCYGAKHAIETLETWLV
jgi:hypothetical protein